MKFHLISNYDYKQYQSKANRLLYDVSRYFNKDIEDISSIDVIRYFEQHYQILFVFIDEDPYEDYFKDLGGRTATKHDLKYRGLVSNCHVKYVSKEICYQLSGMTQTIENSKRYVVYINQNTTSLGRVLFSIMHELSHIYAHYEQGMNADFYASLSSNTDYVSSGGYPKELQLIEDEANTMASIFLINDIRLKKHIQRGGTFNNLLKENIISGQAILNRLRNMLIYDFNTPSHIATQITLDYRNGDNFIQKIVLSD